MARRSEGIILGTFASTLRAEPAEPCSADPAHFLTDFSSRGVGSAWTPPRRSIEARPLATLGNCACRDRRPGNGGRCYYNAHFIRQCSGTDIATEADFPLPFWRRPIGAAFSRLSTRVAGGGSSHLR